MKIKYILLIIVITLTTLIGIMMVAAQEDTTLSDLQRHHANVAQAFVSTFWNSNSTEADLLTLEEEIFANEYGLHMMFETERTPMRNSNYSAIAFTTYFNRLEDIQISIDEMFVADDAVTVITTIQARPKQSWAIRNGFYIPAQDESITWEQVFVFQFNEENLIDELWIFADIPDIEKVDL